MPALIEGLPDAVALRCLAYVPFYQHYNLELISRTWRAAIRSPELFKAREEVGNQEIFLCVCAFEPDNLWQLYDPLHDIWITIPLLPSKISRLSHFGTVSTGGKIFVLGGGSEAVDPLTGDREVGFATDEVWSYDPITRNWSQRASMSIPRSTFACCVLDGKVIVAGGFTSQFKSVTQAEVYDPENNTWASIPELPHTHDSACSGIVIGGKMHVVHKGLSTVQVIGKPFDGWTVEHYDWPKGPMAVFDGVLYILADCRLYRQELEKQKVFVSVFEFRKRLGSAVMEFNGSLYVVGGVIGPNRIFPSIQAIQPMSDINFLTLQSDRPVWHHARPMSRCRGTILGSTTLKI